VTDAKRAGAGFEPPDFDITSHWYYPAPILKTSNFKMGADFLALKKLQKGYICARHPDRGTIIGS
jgi:hypothetical protein